MIPEGWTVQSGEDLSLTITKGSSPNWQGFQYQDSGVLFVTSENVRDGYLDVSEPKFLPSAFSMKERKSQLYKGDILINIVGASIGRSCRFNLDNVEANINQAVCVLRPSSGELGDYLIQYLQSPEAVRQLLGQQSDSARPNLSLEDIRSFKFLVPPPYEQRRIAEILSTWDRTIEATEKLIANNQAQRDTLIQQLLTGKMRLKRFTQSELVRHNKLGPVPSDWKVATIEHVASEVSQRNDGKADYPVLSCSKHDGFVRSLDYFKKQVFSADTSNYKMVKRNQFGFPSNHVEEGSIGLQNIVDCGLVSPIYCVFEPRANMRPFFLYKLLKTDRYRQLFASATNASVDRRGSLRWGGFSQLPIAIPTLEEQEAIGEAIRTAKNHVSALSSDLEKLKREKSALMQQLLTGKRRVKVHTTQEEAA